MVGEDMESRFVVLEGKDVCKPMRMLQKDGEHGKCVGENGQLWSNVLE